MNSKIRFIYVLFICINIQNVFGQDFNQIDSLNRLLHIAKQDTDKVILLTKISVHFWYNNPDTSIFIAQQGLNIAEKVKFEKGIANSLHVMGYAYSIKGNYAAALDCNLKALKIREKLNDKKGLERSYNNIGNIYLDKKDYSTAFLYYQKGLALAEELKIDKDIALLANNIGRMHYFKNEFTKSLEYYKKALDISEKKQYKFEMVISYLNLGRSYVELNDLNKAEMFLNKGLDMAVNMKNKEKTSMALTSLAEIALKKGDYKKSINIGQNALKAAQEIKSLQYIYEASSKLSECYLKLNDYQKSLYYFKIAAQSKDSLFSNDKTKEIHNLQHQFEIEKQKQEIEILAKDNKIAQQVVKNQQLYIIVFATGFVFLIILALVIFRSRQKELKNNILLREQHNKILQQNEIINEKNNRITSSIVYASRIQKAMLPGVDIFNNLVKDYFILYKPKDIVSGDFFWYRNIDEYLYIAAADCTGHGVPGAFMSMLGISLLSETIGHNKIQSPAEVLNKLRKQIKQSLHQTGQVGENQDGMDIALLLIDLKNLTIQFSGAYNPLYIMRPVIVSETERKIEFIELKSDRMPVGVSLKEDQDFTNQYIEILSDDTLYIFSDGYISQFGGKKGETLKSRRFQDILLNNVHKTMQEQSYMLEREFDNWSGEWEQVDDVLVMGVKI